MSEPRPPKGLGAAGRAVWLSMLAAVDEGWDLDGRDLLVLGEAARQADLVDQLEQAISDEGVIAVGAQGQARVSGAVAQLVAARALLTRLLGQVEIRPPAPRTGAMNGRQRADVLRALSSREAG